MGYKQLNLVGVKFNRLLVLEKVESRMYGTTSKRMWQCLCDCGNKTIVSTGSITSSQITSCGCYGKEVKAENGRKSRYKIAKKTAGYRRVFTSYVSNAVNRGIEFTLTDLEFYDLIKMNCFYCNSEPSNISERTHYGAIYNGIDRKDNKKGYTIENCLPCCRMCNIAKNNHTYDEFINWAIKLNQNLQRIKDSL